MAENEVSDSRFLFPELFSFTVEPEILTFLWGFCTKKANDIQGDFRCYLPKTSLLKVFVPYRYQQASFFTFMKYTVATTGVTAIVGLSSYGTFRVLQKIRSEGFRGLRGSLINAYNCVKTPKNFVEAQNMELVLRTGSEDLASGDILKRPSDLVLHSHQNGSSKKPIMQNIQLIKNQVPLHNCVTPINGEMASGDEDTSEVQGQYFGPMCIDGEINSMNSNSLPQSPTPEIFTERYEILLKPSCHQPITYKPHG